MLFKFDSDLCVIYYGGFWVLLNLFVLLCGFVSFMMFVVYGVVFIKMKIDGVIVCCVLIVLCVVLFFVVVLFVLVGVFVVLYIGGFYIIYVVLIDIVVNLLFKDVVVGLGLWFVNYGEYLWMIVVFVVGIVGGVFVLLFVGLK